MYSTVDCPCFGGVKLLLPLALLRDWNMVEVVSSHLDSPGTNHTFSGIEAQLTQNNNSYCMCDRCKGIRLLYYCIVYYRN